MKDENEIWFVLFDGSSSDGRGDGKYIGRTMDIKIAAQHFIKCSANPYSTGEVRYFTNDEYHIANSEFFKNHHNTGWNKK